MKQKIFNLFESALQQRNQRGVDHLALFAQVHNRRRVSLFEGKVDSVEIADEIKVGVWLCVKGSWGSSTFEQVRDDVLDRAIEQAKNAAAFSDPDPHYSLAPPSGTPEVHEADTTITDLKMGQFEDWCRVMEEKAQSASPVIRNVPYIGSGYDTYTRILANSEGLQLSEDNHLLKASVSVMAAGKDERVVNYREGESYLRCQDFAPEVLATDVAAEAAARVDPRGVKTGRYPVLFDPWMAAELLATFNSIFSGDMLYRKLTRLDGHLEKTIATESVNIVDAGMSGLVPHHYDGEGTPSREKRLVANGVFKSFLHNRYTGARMGSTSTGNATHGIGGAPGVCPANIAWDGPAVPVADLLADMDRGLVIKELHGASASPISGDFSYGGLGYWVEKGRIQYPVADFTVAGNFFDLLKDVRGLGNDLHYMRPHWLGSYGGRSFLVGALDIGGTP